MWNSDRAYTVLEWLGVDEDTTPEEVWWSAWIAVAVLVAMTIHIRTMRALRRHHALQRSMEQQLTALLTAIQHHSSTKYMQLDIGVNVHGGGQSVDAGSLSESEGSEGNELTFERLRDGDVVDGETAQ